MTPMQPRARSIAARAGLSRTISVCIAAVLLIGAPALPRIAHAGEIPTFYEKNTLGNGAVWDIAIWPDPKQSYLLSADGENNEIRILNRQDGTVVGSFGHNGRNAGQFHWVHAMAVDAKGNVYTAEVDTGKRIQKFKLTSDALR